MVVRRAADGRGSTTGVRRPNFYTVRFRGRRRRGHSKGVFRHIAVGTGDTLRFTGATITVNGTMLRSRTGSVGERLRWWRHAWGNVRHTCRAGSLWGNQ